MPDMNQFTPAGKKAIAEVQQHLSDAAEAFSRLNAVENHACHNFHGENTSLNHCIRWGLQAAENIQEELG